MGGAFAALITFTYTPECVYYTNYREIPFSKFVDVPYCVPDICPDTYEFEPLLESDYITGLSEGFGEGCSVDIEIGKNFRDGFSSAGKGKGKGGKTPKSSAKGKGGKGLRRKKKSHTKSSKSKYQ